MSFPSLSRIQERLGFGKDKAKRIRGLMDGSRGASQYESVKAWVRECLNSPPKIERVLMALNEELNGFGIESINAEDKRVDGFWLDCVACYVNQGDTYDTTIVYDTERGSYYVTSYGDWVETYERSKRGKVS